MTHEEIADAVEKLRKERDELRADLAAAIKERDEARKFSDINFADCKEAMDVAYAAQAREREARKLLREARVYVADVPIAEAGDGLLTRIDVALKGGADE